MTLGLAGARIGTAGAAGSGGEKTRGCMGSEHTRTHRTSIHTARHTHMLQKRNRLTCTGLPQTMRVNCMGSNVVGAVDSTSRACCLHTSCRARSCSASTPAPGSAVLPAAWPAASRVPHNGCMHCPAPARNSARPAAQVAASRGPGGTFGSRCAMRPCCRRPQSAALFGAAMAIAFASAVRVGGCRPQEAQ